MRLISLVALAGIVSLVAVFGGVAGAHHANKGAKVQVGDDFFNPTSVSIPKGGKVTFKWVGSDKDQTPDGGKLHSILVDPRDAAHLYLSMSGGGTFESTDATGFKYKHKFKKAGTYKLICTVHDGMKTKVTVN